MGGIAASPIIDNQNNGFCNYNRTYVLCKGLNFIILNFISQSLTSSSNNVFVKDRINYKKVVGFLFVT